MSARQDQLQAAVTAFREQPDEGTADAMLDAALLFADADEANQRWMLKGIQLALATASDRVAAGCVLMQRPKFIELSRVFANTIRSVRS